mgnify:CR=1 FL=1
MQACNEDYPQLSVMHRCQTNTHAQTNRQTNKQMHETNTASQLPSAFVVAWSWSISYYPPPIEPPSSLPLWRDQTKTPPPCSANEKIQRSRAATISHHTHTEYWAAPPRCPQVSATGRSSKVKVKEGVRRVGGAITCCLAASRLFPVAGLSPHHADQSHGPVPHQMHKGSKGPHAITLHDAMRCHSCKHTNLIMYLSLVRVTHRQICHASKLLTKLHIKYSNKCVPE